MTITLIKQEMKPAQMLSLIHIYEEQWIKELREKRIAYGISQGRLAVASGITRESVSYTHLDVYKRQLILSN